MTVLGIDTATGSTVAGLLLPGGEVVAAGHHPGADERPQHAALLLELVERVIDESGTTWADVERIAVGVGPGGFTGLRIGIATARALGQASGIPLVAVGTLETLASAVRGDRDTVLAVVDARRKEVFAAAWEGDRRIFGPDAQRPEDLAARVRGLRVLAVGDGALRYRAQLEAAGAVIPSYTGAHRVDPGQLCRLGAAGTPVTAWDLLPDYIRDPDAKPRTP